MRKLRVLVLMHQDLIPPADRSARQGPAIVPWRTEHDIMSALESLGHEVRPIGVHDDLQVLRAALEEWNPHVTFNVLEEFHGVALYGQAVISFLELMRRAYTGCNPRGLMLAHDKLLTKKILSWHRIRTPRCATFPIAAQPRRPRRIGYPLLVKSAVEDASLGISQASIVHSDEKLLERVHYMHTTFGTDVLAEEYIEGRELYVGVLGNSKLEALPIWEMTFNDWPEDQPRIATERVKWSAAYQKRRGIRTGLAQDLAPELTRTIQRTCKQVYRALSLSGYARIDLRLDAQGRVWVIEANANPDLARDEDFAESALPAGLAYPQLVQRIVNLALAWRPAWKQLELAL
ncbi:MAG: ATP-grasp domain-containing protein [Planctomycetes bacterium]|nr:ATP-grasp domain-containing protein [Planctomycetota bacterium]